MSSRRSAQLLIKLRSQGDQSSGESGGTSLTDRFLIRMLMRFVSPYWKQMLLIFGMLVGVTIFSLLPPYLIQRAIDGPIQTGNLDGLWPYGAAYLGSIIALFGLRLWHTILLQTVGQSALVSLRQALFEHILKQDMRFFNTTPVGQIVSRMSNDIEALTELLSTSIVIVASNLVTVIGIAAVMFAINWRLALIGLCVLPVMTIATIYFRRRIRDQSSLYHRVVAEYLAYINEQFGGMLLVQLFGRQSLSRTEFETINRRYRDVHMEIRDLYTIYSSLLQMLTTIGLALVLYGGGYGVLSGWASLGMLVSFIQYTRRSFDPILQLSEQFTQIQTALSAGERIARMLQIQPAIRDTVSPQQPQSFTPSIEIDRLTFGYEVNNPILQDISLFVPAGQRVAIVGATGAGKSSLAGLLTRFYDVSEGSIRISGVEIRDISLRDLRHFVAVVPQTPYCFNGTIADNLRLFDESVTLEQILAAAELACAAPFIERLPGQYDYRLLPGGANLSQGQRQLIALARALIHSPNSVLVLDEATSSIDTETEALIQRGLQQVLVGRTSIVIAHRLSTVRDADRILVMQRGRIVEDGNHDQLLARDGLYSHLHRRQFADLDAAALS